MVKRSVKYLISLALLDNGCLAGDFISQAVFKLVGGESVNSLNYSVDRLRLPICSGVDGTCTNIAVSSLNLNFSFQNESLNVNNFNTLTSSFDTLCRVLPTSPFDVIIGRETIKNFNLAYFLPTHFYNEEMVLWILSTTHPLLLRSRPLHGHVSSEKDNRGQAPMLEAQPPSGCGTRLCGCLSDSASRTESVISTTGSLWIEADLRTHTPRGQRSS